jgi:glucan-binding YG repeat protein
MWETLYSILRTRFFCCLKTKWFYFDEQGAMVNNTTLNIDGVEYTFAKSGNCTNKE